MLDKSVPYVDIYMCRKAGTPLAVCPLPEGFKLVGYAPGDEKDWAVIETSVLEFSDSLNALLYFQREFLQAPGEAGRRCLFVESPEGEKVATASAWWRYYGLKRYPMLHWIAVKPEFQGLGIGKAVSYEATRLLIAIEGDRDLYLHTQTWSHKAVKIYEMLGYKITKEKCLSDKSTEENYEKAIAVLKSIYAGK